MHATFELVAERISITSGIPVDSLRPDTAIKDLTLDSLLLIEMAIGLQEEFDTIFSQEALQRVVTITDLVDLLNTPQTPATPPSRHTESSRTGGRRQAAPVTPVREVVLH